MLGLLLGELCECRALSFAVTLEVFKVLLVLLVDHLEVFLVFGCVGEVN